MRTVGLTPDTVQQPGDDDILLMLRTSAKTDAWLAALEQHCVATLVRLEQSYGWLSIPEPQPEHLVPPFHVGHSELQDRVKPSAQALALPGEQLTSSPTNGSPSGERHFSYEVADGVWK
jgi:hypothetical protein